MIRMTLDRVRLTQFNVTQTIYLFYVALPVREIHEKLGLLKLCKIDQIRTFN